MNPVSFRLSLVSRLAWFADPQLQSQLRTGNSVNGTVDFEDILLAWDYGPLEEGRLDGSLNPVELALLKEFDQYLTETYLQFSDSWKDEDWSWLYTNKKPAPESWAATSEKARVVLKHFPDFRLSEWRERGYPTWG